MSALLPGAPPSPALLAELAKYAPDCRAKLLELHAKYRFDECQLECFVMNEKTMTMDKIPAFQELLEKERIRTTPVPSPRGRPSTGGADSRRKPGGAGTGGSLLSDTLSAALGRPRPVAAVVGVDVEAAAPSAKRPRAEAVLEAVPAGVLGTPPTQAPSTALVAALPAIPVSLKSSLNERNLAKLTLSGGVQVELLGDSQLWTGNRNGAYVWMDEAPDLRAAARDARLATLEREVVAAVQQRHAEKETVLGTVGVPVQAEAVLCGRIVCEGLEGRLNERSLLLEGSRGSSNGARVQLSVEQCQRVAAFPGQVVGVLGRSGMSGSTFHARDFLPGLPPPLSTVPAGSGLHMLTLAGPFCLRNTLNYAPLERALQHAVQERPQVLVLLGPFLDANNTKVTSGDVFLPGCEDEPCSFEDFYAEHLLPLLQRCLAPLRRANPPTEVLIVPSLDEVLCFHPMPQPPLDASLGPDVARQGLEQLKRLGVRFLPNPAHLRINGLRISLTSADALSPVLREIVLRPEGKKIEEALRLLVYQRGLFPVVPRDPAQVSEARAAALDFPDGAPPDVCVFPSSSGTATGTVVDGTVFVNPGPLCRPAAFGSFAEMWVAPAGSAGAGDALRERLRVDIQKLG